jgi:hypothetical protein
MCSPFGGTPVARLILIRPGVHFKSVEGDALPADGNVGEVGLDFGVEAVAVHAEVSRCIAKAQQPRQENRCAYRVHFPM